MISFHLLKTVSMPMGMVVGALLCREIEWLDGVARHMLTPAFIFTMLFFTFCRVDARRIRLSWMHAWLLLFQAAGCLAVYYALAPDKETEQMAWVAYINGLNAIAEEIVLTELVYS